MLRPLSIPAIFALSFISLLGSSAAEPKIQQLGAGSYLVVAPAGAKSPQGEIYATDNVRGKMPTNDWWSSAAWMKFSERQYPHPLAVEAVPTGLRVFYPGNNVTANEAAIFGFMPANTGDDLILGHSDVKAFDDAKVDGFSDWFVSLKFGDDARSLKITYGHGSPFMYAQISGGSPTIALMEPAKVWSGDETSPALGITLRGKHYGLFGPTGSKWEGMGSKTLVNRSKKPYVSVAVLPDDKPETLKLFQRYAYAHVTDTQVAWQYDPATATVHTDFAFKTRAFEGDETATLFALYPHQWRHAEIKPLASYNSVRGEMKLAAGKSFRTTMRFPGVLPCLPPTKSLDAKKLADLIRRDLAEPATPPLKDTYWDGKWLGKFATIASIAEANGLTNEAQSARGRIRTRLEDWFTAADKQGNAQASGAFAYNKQWGTLIGYPASYGSDVELNDHHFHYGYFLKAAAEIAERDPNWASDERFGSMVKLLVRDFANPRRDDPEFPFLRNFDPYAGHTWASGHAKFGDGNNNESSSEAMNAWTGLILWGEATGDRELRDLGIYLYTTEMNAIQEYWFDIHDRNHPQTFTPSVVTMIWGGKGANGTWFSANPEVVHGINWLPLHGGSLYLGHRPDYVRKNYEALVAENKGVDWDQWRDLVWMYRALSDPDDAHKQFESDREGKPYEEGNTAANAYHWITALGDLGQVDPSIIADDPFIAVFQKGNVRTYVAYNLTNRSKTVTFSDGTKVEYTKRGFYLQTTE